MPNARSKPHVEASRRRGVSRARSSRPLARTYIACRPTEDFETLAARVALNPDLARYLSEQRLRDSELRLAREARRSDLTVAAGVRRFEETGDNALVLSFSVPLALADRNQGAIAESRARLDKVAVEREAALLDAQTRLFEFYQELLQARAEVEALQALLIPQGKRGSGADGEWI